jgi:hypothetical protein
MSKLHDTLPPEPTHEPVVKSRITITFDLSLDVDFETAQEVERLVKSYLSAQLNEDIQDGFTNWCANIECADDALLDHALDLEQLKVNVRVPDYSDKAEAKRKADKARRDAKYAAIRAALAMHRAQQTVKRHNLRVVPKS